MWYNVNKLGIRIRVCSAKNECLLIISELQSPKQFVIQECNYKFKGKVSIVLCFFDGSEHIITESKVEDLARLHANFAQFPATEFLYPKIYALTECVFIEGCYCSDCDPSEIKVCIAICTYKREEYVLKNIDFVNIA